MSNQFSIDSILTLPKKIEFVSYPSGAGGDFYSSLISSHYNLNKNISTAPPRNTNKKSIPRFLNPIYLKFDNVNTGHELMQRLKFLQNVSYNMDSKETIQLAKNIIISEMFNYCKNYYYYNKLNFTEFPDINELLERHEFLYKNSIFVFPLHFLMWSDKNINDFCSTNYWSILNIGPLTNKGKQFCVNSANYFFNMEMLKTTFSDSIKAGDEHFPFIELMMNKQFNEIIDFIKSHYGNEFDFENISKQLDYYYKKRVSPFLNS